MLGRLEMDIPTCIQWYKKLSKTIFQNRKTVPFTLTGQIRPRFNHEPLEEEIMKIIKSAGYDELELF